MELSYLALAKFSGVTLIHEFSPPPGFIWQQAHGFSETFRNAKHFLWLNVIWGLYSNVLLLICLTSFLDSNLFDSREGT